MTQKEIGAKIKAARIKKGLTQREFAEAIGYDSPTCDSTIRCIESGKTHPPYIRLRRMSEVLEISVYDMIP